MCCRTIITAALTLLLSSYAEVSGQSLPSGWNTRDVGDPALTGGAAHGDDTFLVAGAGADIWGHADQFRFVYQEITGDVDIIARVGRIDPTSAWAKAGVMIRASLDADAAHASMFVTPGRGVAFQRRPEAGQASVHTFAGEGTAPAWVKLQRRGDIVTAFRSADGAAWTAIAQQPLVLPATFFAGLAVTSHNAGRLTAASFDNVAAVSPAGDAAPTIAMIAPVHGEGFTAPATVTLAAAASGVDDALSDVEFFVGTASLGTAGAPPHEVRWTDVPPGTHSVTAAARDVDGRVTSAAPRAITVAAPRVPDGWTAGDVGSPAVSGQAAYLDGAFVLEGAGADIWGAHDEFFFAHRLIAGDVDIVARVASVERTADWTKAGVMIRSTLTGGAAHASLFVTPGKGLAFQRRPSEGGTSVHTTVGVGTAPAWVKLQRRGDLVTALRSVDGTTWTAVGTQTLALPGDAYVGLALTSHEEDALATATFQSVSVTTPAPEPTPPVVALTAPADGAVFTAPAAIELTADATDADDGVARVEFFAGTTLIGTDTSSPYAVTWTDVPAGTFSLTAVAHDQGGLATTSAARTVTVAGQLPPEWTATGVGSPVLAGSAGASDGIFTVSGAGADIWDRHDEFMFVHQVMGDDVDVVARVASFEAAQDFAKAGVMIRESLASNAAHVSMFVTPARGFRFHVRPATDALSSSETAEGAAPAWVKLARRGSTVTGSYSLDGVTWTVLGSQTLPLPATFYVGLAVGSVDPDARATAAFDNVAVTTPIPDTTPPTVELTAPADGATVSGIVIVTAVAEDETAVRDVTFRVGGTVIGTVSSSPYTLNWDIAAAPAGTHVLTAEAADTAGNRATSPEVTVHVAIPNGPPAVAITAPVEGATFTAPAAITVTADATDPDDGVSRVDFYAGTTLIGSDAAAPYGVTWNDVPAGSYALTAVAHDASGASATSPVRSVVISDPQPPGRAVFVPSSNHDTAVEQYVLEVFTAGADPETATPVQTQDLGKPAIVDGECTADVTGTILSLPSGTYIATVTAVGPGGSARSLPSPAFER